MIDLGRLAMLARLCLGRHRASRAACSWCRDFVSVGEVYEKRAEFTQSDVDAFVRLTGDSNPIHASRASGTAAVVPGLLCSSLFPAIIGSSFPGSLYLSQSLEFRSKVHVGDAIHARLVVKSVQGRRTTFFTQCFKRGGGGGGGGVGDGEETLVIKGEARALVR